MRAALVGFLVAASTSVVEGCGGDVNRAASAGTAGTGGVETDEADGGGGADGGEATGMECRDLAQAACEARDDCSALSARVDTLDNSGEDVPFVACITAGSCGYAETCAWDGADGQVLWFPSTCIPDGWLMTDCGNVSTIEGSPDDVSGVVASQVDGVWVFHYDPQGSLAALMQGQANIVDGCLYIADFLVVWHVDRLDELEGIIAAVQAGEQPVVAVGGFARFVGVDPDGGEPLVLPSVIADHCSAEAVWFGSPD